MTTINDNYFSYKRPEDWSGIDITTWKMEIGVDRTGHKVYVDAHGNKKNELGHNVTSEGYDIMDNSPEALAAANEGHDPDPAWHTYLDAMKEPMEPVAIGYIRNHKAREEDIRLKKRIERTLKRSINEEQFHRLVHWFFDWRDEVFGEDEETQRERQEQRDFAYKFYAFLLRNDLDRVFWGHPYPSPTTERLRKLKPLADYLYGCDDPSGFLGPSAGEIVYYMQAIEISRVMGNTDFDDLPHYYAHFGGENGNWYSHSDMTEVPEHLREDFAAWLETDDYYYMFSNRKVIKGIDYDSYFKDAEYREQILEQMRESSEGVKRGASTEAAVDDGEVCSSE